MGKRSDFPRLPQDAYETPADAVEPLLKLLLPSTRFIEPCAGEGRLVEHLERAGHVCVGRYDLPTDAAIACYDTEGADAFVTNPPWRRDLLHALIVNLSDQLPTWLLIDADWIFTKQSVPYMERLRVVRAVGRTRWIPGSPYTSKDSIAWHLFGRPDPNAATVFIGRSDSMRRAA